MTPMTPAGSATGPTSVGQDWAFEATLLRPLPDEAFDTALTLTPRVDRYAQVMVRCNQYSVPARFIGHRLRVKLSASTVTVYDRTTVVARHQRAIGKGAKVLDLDHYLEILLRKPGALPGATALVAGPRGRRCSPPSMRRSGPPPAKPTATRRAPARSSRCCCCTATSTAPTCSPASPPRCRSARSARCGRPGSPQGRRTRGTTTGRTSDANTGGQVVVLAEHRSAGRARR